MGYKPSKSKSKPSAVCAFLVTTAAVMGVATVATTAVTAVANESPRTHWYRYYDNGVPQTSKTLTDKHLASGYEELDSGFRVIRKIAPYSKADAQAEDDRQAAEQKKAEERQHLIKIYGSSERATRKRSQMISDVYSKRTFALQQLIAVNQSLQSEIARAAQLENAGKPVPADLKARIDELQGAVKASKAALDSLLYQQFGELDKMTQDIRRLRKFERELGGH